MGAPTASFTYLRAGSIVSFTDTSEANPGSIVAWSWSIDSAPAFSTEQNPYFTFTPGTYEVELSVTDSSGLVSSITQEITIGITGTVGVTVCCKLPPSLCETQCVTEYVRKWQNYLANQKEPELEGPNIENQDSWKYLENVFIGELAVYETIISEGTKWAASGNIMFDPSSDSGTGTKMIKTGPDEVEWWNNQDNQTDFFKTILTAGGLEKFREHLCQTAERIGFYLPFCKSKNLGNMFKKAGRTSNNSSKTYLGLPSWIN